MDNLDVETRTSIVEELGFSMVVEDVYKLILWNDHVNDMMSVIEALISVCGLNPEHAMAIMMTAHEEGKALAKTGSLKEMTAMKDSLNLLKLEATVEL